VFRANLKLLADSSPAAALRARGEARGPVAECPEEWIEGLNLGSANLLYVFGLGQGGYYTALKSWLEADASRRLVLLEHEEGNLVRWLEGATAGEALADGQVDVHFFDTPLDPLFAQLCAENGAAQVAFAAHEALVGTPLAEALGARLVRDAATVSRIVDEFRRHGDLFFENFYTNLFLWHEAVWGAPLFGKFKGVPAIICGAGPSLDKNIDVLAGLRDKALIFAGGSALNATSCRGVLPHFGAGIDPHYPQFQRLMMNAAFEVPIFYRHRWQTDALPLIQGTPLYLNGSGGQRVAEWFERRLGIGGRVLDEGHNVVNWTVEIARALGCDPIVCIGLDLAYTEGRPYAGGVAADSCEDGSHHYDQSVTFNGHQTHWKWIAEAEWLGSKGVVNATEGGIGFPGAPDIPLAEVAERFKRSWPLDEWVRAEIEKARAHVIDQSQVLALLEELKASLERSIERLRRLEKQPTALDEVELEEEAAWEAILEVQDYLFRNQKLGDNRFAFLREGAEKNLEILRFASRQHRPHQ
jgi:hypothetical protein